MFELHSGGWWYSMRWPTSTSISLQRRAYRQSKIYKWCPQMNSHQKVELVSLECHAPRKHCDWTDWGKLLGTISRWSQPRCFCVLKESQWTCFTWESLVWFVGQCLWRSPIALGWCWRGPAFLQGNTFCQEGLVTTKRIEDHNPVFSIELCFLVSVEEWWLGQGWQWMLTVSPKANYGEGTSSSSISWCSHSNEALPCSIEPRK